MGRQVPKRILIVEDDDAQLEVIQATLKMLGYDVLGIDTAERVIETAIDYDPELIIMDVSMPGKEGTEALVILRDYGISTPVLLYSARYSASDQRPMEHYVHLLGGQDFLLKPFSIEQLERRVVKLIGGPTDA